MSTDQLIPDGEINEDNMRLTMVSGAVIEKKLIYIAQYFDKYADYADEIEQTRLSFADIRREASPSWIAHDVNWRVNSVCVWDSFPNVKRLYVALSSEGDIEMIGPGGQPTFVEHIEGAGLYRPWSRQLGYLNRVRQIGSSLYACGGANQVYKRLPDQPWILISGDIIVEPSERLLRENAMAAIRHLNDIAGKSERDIYTIGLSGEVHHFDGVSWAKVITGTDRHLTGLAFAEGDEVFICGAHSTLLRGNKDKGFKSVWNLEDEAFFSGIAYFGGLIWLASTRRGIYTFDPATKETISYKSGLQPDLADPHLLEVKEGVLWCFGFKDLAYFDGHNWTRVDHPDNPPIVE